MKISQAYLASRLSILLQIVLYLHIRSLLDKIPLSENTKQTIRCTDGGSNQFLIQDGAVTMTDADCGDKTCVKTGSIKETGQSIVCLPHRLVITITDSSSDSAPDAIVR